MPRDQVDLPQTLQRSSDKAQDTYAETLVSAEEQYDGDEARAHRTAWGAVKHSYEKTGDHWERKEGGRRGPSDAQSARSGAAARRGGPTSGGVDEHATKKHLQDLAARAQIRGRSRMTKQELVDALQKANDEATRAAR